MYNEWDKVFDFSHEYVEKHVHLILDLQLIDNKDIIQDGTRKMLSKYVYRKT